MKLSISKKKIFKKKKKLKMNSTAGPSFRVSKVDPRGTKCQALEIRSPGRQPINSNYLHLTWMCCLQVPHRLICKLAKQMA